MILRILAEAEVEIQASVEWYDRRGEGLGLTFLHALTSALLAIEATPRRFPIVSQRNPIGAIRSVSLGKFPFQIIYEIRADETIILAVAHHKRRPGYWTRRQS